MISNFWENLPPKFSVLAPMADVTDKVFRQLVAKYSRMHKELGGPAVLWTEFVSCDGLVSSGRDQILRDLEFDNLEQPVVAQIFGSTPENFYQTAKILKSLGFAGIDINAGCPDRAVNRQGAGAGMIKDFGLMKACFDATTAGASTIPVSIKTRLGFSKIQIDDWIKPLIELGPVALTIHARTRNELSKVEPHWDAFTECVKIAKGTGIKMIANGGILSINDGEALCDKTGCDGFMVGKGIFGKPWFFDKELKLAPKKLKDYFDIMIEHALLYEEKLGELNAGDEFTFGNKKLKVSSTVKAKNFNIMKKHFKAYINGFDGAKDLRVKLMDANSATMVESILRSFTDDNPQLVTGHELFK